MERVVRLGQKAAASNIPILIEGESGVGKELVARAIQGRASGARKPFVTVNCGAIPQNLVESILFGHEKGAFTGATEKHAGKFVEAHGGTLFLDEIGDLPLEVQVKLLRAVQDGEIDPVGARAPVKVDIRLISATHRDLLQRVQRRPVPRGSVLPPATSSRSSCRRCATAATTFRPGRAFHGPLRAQPAVAQGAHRVRRGAGDAQGL